MNDQYTVLEYREKRTGLGGIIQITYTTKKNFAEKIKVYLRRFPQSSNKIKKFSLLNSEDETVNLQNPILWMYLT